MKWDQNSILGLQINSVCLDEAFLAMPSPPDHQHEIFDFRANLKMLN